MPSGFSILTGPRERGVMLVMLRETASAEERKVMRDVLSPKVVSSWKVWMVRCTGREVNTGPGTGSVEPGGFHGIGPVKKGPGASPGSGVVPDPLQGFDISQAVEEKQEDIVYGCTLKVFPEGEKKE